MQDVERHREEYAKVYENLWIYKFVDSAQANKIEEQARKVEDQASRIERLEEKLKETQEVLVWMQKREGERVIDNMAKRILESVSEEDEDMQAIFLKAMEKDLERHRKRKKKRS
jgi:thioesterase domain-containing protein